mgnify:CR=1 FL=1
MGAMVPPSRKSCYNFRVVSIDRVLDGDTIDVTIDLGFDLYKKERVRVAGVDTPEKRTRDLEEKALGIDATNWLKEKLEGAISGDDELAEAGIDVHGLGQSKLKKAGTFAAMTKGFHNAEAKCLVADWIAQNDTPSTVYHLHNWAQILSPGVFAALKPVEARTIVSCHDFFNVCPNGGLLNFQTGEICKLKPMSAACWVSQCDRRNSAPNTGAWPGSCG